MSNSAAKELMKAVKAAEKDRGHKIAEHNEWKRAADEEISDLRRSVQRACVHEKVRFKDTTFINGHNGDECGDRYAVCEYCGVHRSITESEYDNCISPWA